VDRTFATGGYATRVAESLTSVSHAAPLSARTVKKAIVDQRRTVIADFIGTSRGLSGPRPRG
jgi:hypothetical protein